MFLQSFPLICSLILNGEGEGLRGEGSVERRRKRRGEGGAEGGCGPKRAATLERRGRQQRRQRRQSAGRKSEGGGGCTLKTGETAAEESEALALTLSLAS